MPASLVKASIKKELKQHRLRRHAAVYCNKFNHEARQNDSPEEDAICQGRISRAIDSLVLK